MTRLFLILLSIVSVCAQRTPVKVNGSVVNNPNLTNTASVTWSVAGGNVSGTAKDTIWTNSAGIVELIGDTNFIFSPGTYSGYAPNVTVRTQLNIGSSGVYLAAPATTLRIQSPVKVSSSTPGKAVPIELDNTNTLGDSLSLALSVQGTNITTLDSAVQFGGTAWEWWIYSRNISGTLSPQVTAYSQGDMVLGFASLIAAGATNGFLHIPSIADTPTGAPYFSDQYHTPIVFDRTSNRLWAYNTNWFDTCGQVLLLTSDAAIDQYILVKYGTDANHVDVCGAANIPMGVAMTSASGGSQALRVMLLNGTVFKLNTAGTVTFGTILEPASNGKVQSITGGVGTHYGVGRALETATNRVFNAQILFFKQQI